MHAGLIETTLVLQTFGGRKKSLARRNQPLLLPFRAGTL
jgi:hypothetical protein